jgi:hypothetical protein
MQQLINAPRKPPTPIEAAAELAQRQHEREAFAAAHRAAARMAHERAQASFEATVRRNALRLAMRDAAAALVVWVLLTICLAAGELPVMAQFGH